MIGVLWLLFSQILNLRTPEIIEDLYVDTTLKEKYVIQFDITFPRMPCESLQLAAMDASGSLLDDVTLHVNKVSIGKDGRFLAIETNSHDDAGWDSTSKSDSCKSCYGAKQKGNCCNTCNDVRTAFDQKGWLFERTERFEQCGGIFDFMIPTHGRRKRPVADKGDKGSIVGCEAFGYLTVPRSTGQIRFSPDPYVSRSQMINNILYRRSAYADISHTIHHMSFTDEETVKWKDIDQVLTGALNEFSNYSNPLQNVVKTLDHPSAVRYFLQVIPTTFSFTTGLFITGNQISATQLVRRINAQESLSDIVFSYESAPLRMGYRQNSKSLGQFFTNVCAIVGGFYSVTGILDQTYYKFSKKKMVYIPLKTKT
eukprot:CAMPEP_0204837296 /NCGR_PEP_ID=MMETSP1346-20131115/27355_1 /ASSEMBLY_ACC=CAM_ASM_000771 /TAXON_ID=215587 /ORGANISM="Aplanochytrium stocchinoi, Strain GSBS06" /LENGTH=368 /DNA_ID=CAMNT_0051972611 /DNA_START=126 /DNA_END=1232 /DNA_ORIENTATION=+